MSMEDYAAKKAAFDDAAQARAQVLMLLRSVITDLSTRPELFHFSECGGDFPPEVMTDRNAPSFDAREWPSAQAIQDILVQWHLARRAAYEAWRALSSDQQSAMQPPAGYRPGR